MQNHTTAPTAHNDNEQSRGMDMEYRLDVTSHINARFNRNIIRANFIVGREYGLPDAEHIALLHAVKDRIRRGDAEPAAWSFRPDRYDWVQQRLRNGELMTDEQLGRALQGNEHLAA